MDVAQPASKLRVTWVGPYRVVSALEHSYVIKHLLTDQEREVHASRMKFYRDVSLNVTEELLAHVANRGMLLTVREISIIVLCPAPSASSC